MRPAATCSPVTLFPHLSTPDALPIDIVAIGGLNIDHRVTIGDDPGIRQAVASLCPSARWGSEITASTDAFTAITDRLAGKLQPPRLGGSAFNALRAIRAIDPSMPVGMIGIIGNTVSAQRFADWFREKLIATPFVRDARDLPPGGCLSLENGEERTLITTRGANDRVADLLREENADIVRWISQARIVHLTSLLDDKSPALLADLLECCKTLNPDLEISIDPGAHWAAKYHRDERVRRLLDLSTIMFLNPEEFDLVHGQGSSSARDTPGIRQQRLTLLKLPDALVIYDSAGRLMYNRPHSRLRPDEIRDTTGAGDVLAGACVLARLRQGSLETSGLAAAQAVASTFLRCGWDAERMLAAEFARGLRAESH